jgi:hypothetical protein
VRSWITDEEILRLQMELRSGNSPRGIKRGLQDLCGHYEAGRRLKDATDIRALIHSHMGGPDVAVRRWSLKALALIKSPEDTSRIVDRLKAELDPKARSWGVAGLVRQAKGKGWRRSARKPASTGTPPLSSHQDYTLPTNGLRARLNQWQSRFKTTN